MTIFRSRPDPGALQEYEQSAGSISALARDDRGVWSEQTLADWSRHPNHVAAKRLGRDRFCLEYSIQVCSVVRESRFPGALT